MTERRTSWLLLRALFALAVVGIVASVAFVLLPFGVAASGETPALQCGPAPYELLVPADAAVPSPEDDGCDTPASERLLFGGAALAVSVAAAVGVRRLGRRGNVAADADWLARH
jgi:hypothetical protein